MQVNFGIWSKSVIRLESIDVPIDDLQHAAATICTEYLAFRERVEGSTILELTEDLPELRKLIDRYLDAIIEEN